MYGYKSPAFSPAYGAPAPAYPMARHRGYGTTAFGADAAAAAPSLTDKAKAFLDEPTLGMANKFWLGGALVGAGVWWYVANH